MVFKRFVSWVKFYNFLTFFKMKTPNTWHFE